MKKTLWIALLSIMLVVLILKTIQAAQFHGIGATALYYGEMFKNTWQAQFNVDLWIHTLLFACWIFYRERSKVVGAVCGLACIYLGALFSLFYLIFIFIRAKNDTDLLFKGSKVIVA